MIITTVRALEALLFQITEQSKVQPDAPLLLNSNEYSLTALRGDDVVGMVCKPSPLTVLTIHDPNVNATIIEPI